MALTVDLTDETVAILQQYAVPLTDSADTAIRKMHEIIQREKPQPEAPRTHPPLGSVTGMVFSIDQPPDLRHTSIRQTRINGKPGPSRWNGVYHHLIRQIPKDILRSDKVSEYISGAFVRGRREDMGYHYLQDIDLSLQGRDTNNMWRFITHLAGKLNMVVEIEFFWQDKAGAAYPGVRAHMSNRTETFSKAA
jgi:hypothetical protein